MILKKKGIAWKYVGKKRLFGMLLYLGFIALNVDVIVRKLCFPVKIVACFSHFVAAPNREKEAGKQRLLLHFGVLGGQFRSSCVVT